MTAEPPTEAEQRPEHGGSKSKQLELLKERGTQHPLTNLKQVLKAITATGSTLYRTPDGEIEIDTVRPEIADAVARFHADIVGEVIPSIDETDRKLVADVLDGLKVEYVTTDAEAAVKAVLADAEESGCFAFDTETAVYAHLLDRVPVELTKSGTIAKRQPKTGVAGYALDPMKAYLRLLQVYAGGETVYLFDTHDVDWPVLSTLFRSVPIAAFNAVFDVKFLIAGPGIEPTARIYDTMTAMRLIDGSREGLGKAAKALLGINLPKTLGASDWHHSVLTPDQLEYAAADAVVTFRMWQAQRDSFDEIDEHVQAMADDLIVPTARMELAGLPLDLEKHQSMVHRWEASMVEAQDALRAATGGCLTGIPTTGQVSAYLAETLPEKVLKAWPKTKTKALSTSKPTLKNYGEDVPGIDELLVVREWAKALSTYGTSLSDHIGVDGRLRSSFLIAGARTGRYSSQSVNLQNMPKRGALLAGFREIFRPAPGRLIISADYSQIELRIAAEESGDENMREAFFHRDDLHRRTARMLTNGEPTKAERTMAKAAAFGLLYGSGIRGFRKFAKAVFGLVLSHDEAVELVDLFFAAYPQLRQWQKRQERTTRRNGEVSTVGGRRWQFIWRSHTSDDPGIDELEEWQVGDWLDGYERNFALNHPIQGTAAEIIGVALVYVDRGLRGLDARIGAVVHDELVIECVDDPGTVRAARRLLVTKMTRAWLEFYPDAPWRGVIDITQGPSWGEQNERCKSEFPELR